MELFLIKHVPISIENNRDDNQILISTSNHFYSHFLGGPLFSYHPVDLNLSKEQVKSSSVKQLFSRFKRNVQN